MKSKKFVTGDRCMVEGEEGFAGWMVVAVEDPLSAVKIELVDELVDVRQILICSTQHGLKIAYVLDDRVTFDLPGCGDYRFDEVYVSNEERSTR